MQRGAAPVQERAFVLRRAGADVPGILWTPSDVLRPRAVLVGHGGSGHKRSARVLHLARWLATRAGLATVALDGPFHGERAAADYHTAIAAEGAERVVDRMIADWMHALDTLGQDRLICVDSVGVFGMSMGARYGIATAAALGSRLRCAVFGKLGLVQSAALPPAIHTAERTVRDARLITAPLLFQVQWDDELFPRAGQLALFEEFASDDKRLLARPGAHGATEAGDERAWLEFLRRAM